MQPYPLYEYLAAAAATNRPIDVNKLYGTLNSLATTLTPTEAAEHYQELDALIYHYYLLNGGAVGQLIPFTGNVFKGGKGILYQLASFPPHLIRLLAEYVEHYSR
jgi:hypothetical protein